MSKNNLEMQLQYSKQELMQADAKLNSIISATALLMASSIALIITFHSAIWQIAIISTYIVMLTISLTSSLLGILPRLKKGTGNSPYYFMDNTEDAVTKYNDGQIIDTIKINSRLSKTKYKFAKFSIAVAFPPILIYIAINSYK